LRLQLAVGRLYSLREGFWVPEAADAFSLAWVGYRWVGRSLCSVSMCISTIGKITAFALGVLSKTDNAVNQQVATKLLEGAGASVISGSA